jgi:DNA topoisomerase III
VDREREIEEFVAEKFWTVHARFARDGEHYDGLWFKGKQNRLSSKEAAEEISTRAEGGTGAVRKVQKKTATEKLPLLHDLTELQRNANAWYGFSADRTLKAAQALYEQRKLITYPRTSSRYLSGDMVPGLKGRVEAAGGLQELAPFAGELLALEKLPVTKRLVDDTKVTDHHAIVPTNKKPSGELPSDEAKVYDLVARRFLSVFFPEARFENTTVITDVEGETFVSKGRVVLEAGWRRLYPGGVGGKKETEPPVLPEVQEGQEWPVVKVGVKEGETKPPPRYSESALLGAMETAGKLVEDEELRQQVKDSGLGTPATRAATIERLLKVGYAERQKKTLVPTDKGRALISLLGGDSLASPELTARWEERLAKMERGGEDRAAFMRDIERFTASVVDSVRGMQGEKVAAPTRTTKPHRGNGNGKSASGLIGDCPKCGAPVVETKKAYGCSAWKESGCKFAIWKTVAGKRVSEAQAKQLLANGRTSQLKGFKSKAGKPFSAALALDADHRVRLDFGD